jgi:CRISPR-associated endonuclease/helicase Cas3
LAIPYDDLGINGEERRILTQVVAFHHEREEDICKTKTVENYEKNMLPIRKMIEEEIGVEIEATVKIKYLRGLTETNRIRPSDGKEIYLRYVLLKGLLHRLDHAASAHVPIEVALEMNVSEYVTRFIYKEYKGNKKPLQQFAESHQQEHLIIVAQTGMGKTEAGLLWLGSDKGFFTLPLRVSINAMYQRIIDKIGFSKVTSKGIEEATGLLHSSSYDYLYDKQEGNDDALEKIHAQSKEYANKLVISTIDQILKFPIHYLGFEKEAATVAASKVIIDELQAYNPRIAALLVKALVMIDQLGGSFMIMTATLPDIYHKALLRKLKSPRTQIISNTFIDDSIKRHHLTLCSKSIVDNEIISDILEIGKKKKVLVICNTVNRAREVYELLNSDNCFLLHSRFIKKDRKRLEQNIMDFAIGHDSGIWVTTQLVEASLDIDFDFLFTEMSSLDSLFQRLGRCNRYGIKPCNQKNIVVLTEDVTGIGFVYHQEIYERSVELLYQHSDTLLLESVKNQLVQQLYDEQELTKINSQFKKEFDMALEELDNQLHYKIAKKTAQRLLREIDEVEAIPDQFSGSEEIEGALEMWKVAKDRATKRKARQIIEQYTVGVNRWKGKSLLREHPLIKGLYHVDCMYDEKKGLLLDQELDPFS